MLTSSVTADSHVFIYRDDRGGGRYAIWLAPAQMAGSCPSPKGTRNEPLPARICPTIDGFHGPGTHQDVPFLCQEVKNLYSSWYSDIVDQMASFTEAPASPEAPAA